MTLTKPGLKDKEIVRVLLDVYGLNIEKISLLPIGADFNTTVYRVTTLNKEDYFLKLRVLEYFDEASVSVPKYLADSGINQVIPPLPTKFGQISTNLGSFKMILYPYIKGHNAIELKLSAEQWTQFGATMKKLHTLPIPSNLIQNVPQETFSSKWPQTLKELLINIQNETFTEPLAAKTIKFLKSKNAKILKLIQQTEELTHTFQKQPLEYVLCHADIHGWNLLTNKDGALYIVDWDTLTFAPKERDLMFISAGIWDSGLSPTQENFLFYQGYGLTKINQDLICYYRLERIIQDICEYCKHIFLSNENVERRMQSFQYLRSNFLPGNTIDRAYPSE